MIIELENIYKNYKNNSETPERIVLENISLKISEKDSIAIVGPSGSGKSTLLNIIGTLDIPTSGFVKINNQDIGKLNDRQLAAIRAYKIGFVFQLHHLFPQLPLLENVLVPAMLLDTKQKKEEAQSRAMDLLTLVGLSDKIYQRPAQLSVGECQRAAVVRALINNPDIILADEPTGSLDQKSAEQIGALLSEINNTQNVAIVLVTHSMVIASKMKSIYKLELGKLSSTT